MAHYDCIVLLTKFTNIHAHVYIYINANNRKKKSNKKLNKQSENCNQQTARQTLLQPPVKVYATRLSSATKIKTKNNNIE